MKGRLAGEHKFIFNRVLGRGTFGEVYLATSEQTGQQVAIKKEVVVGASRYSDKAKYSKSLLKEWKILRILEGSIGIPAVYSYVRGPKDMLVYEALGSNLDVLRVQKCHGRFSEKTVLMLADQMFSRLELLHSCGFVHRDIKPQNWVMGVKQSRNVVHLIDFGLCTRATPTSKPKRVGGSMMVGTARFASIRAHACQTQAFEDDIESLIYVLVFLFNGKLPWQGMGQIKPPFTLIRKCKEDTKLSDLCKGLPESFQKIIQNCRMMSIKPPYTAQRQIVRSAIYAMGEVMDWEYDWSTADGWGGVTAQGEAKKNSLRGIRWNDRWMKRK